MVLISENILVIMLRAAIVMLALCFSSLAQEASNIGSVTKLPIPRFVSLKPSDTPMREGPSKDHRIKWVFKKEGLPVEIIGEFEHWRRVRDSESTDGWVYYARLSNRRTVIIRSPKDGGTRNILQADRDGSAVVAKLQSGVIADIVSCSISWCKVSVEGYTGYIEKDGIWGVYPDENIK